MTASLAERLRQETQALHTEVEGSAFMARLLRGGMDRAGYSALLRNLLPLYAALETALEAHANHPLLEPFRTPALYRTATLESDLQALHGPGWDTAFALQPAGREYARRIQWLSETAPGKLVAHAYVRYLGDLSGGQVLQKIVARSLGLDTLAGTAFYRFGDLAQTRELAREFRARLAALPAQEAEIAEIVAEARTGFALHATLFEELAAAYPAGPGGPLRAL